MTIFWIILSVIITVALLFVIYHNWPKFFTKVVDTTATQADKIIDQAKTKIKGK